MVGGKAVLTIVPDTVLQIDTTVVYDTIYKTIVDTVIVEVPVPCPECPPQCPEGWICEPPPEPDVAYVLEFDGVVVADGDTVPTGVYEKFAEDREGVWKTLGLGNNGNRAPGIDSIVFKDPNGRRNKEGLYPYGVWRERGDWTVAAGRTYTIIFDVHETDGPIVTDTVRVTGNPDTPPVPPDTLPPEPGDTLAFFDIDAPDVTWGPRDSTGAAVVSWPAIIGTRIRYSTYVNVTIPDFYLETDDRTWWNNTGGTTTSRTVSEPPESPMAVCVRTNETGQVGRGPGGYYVADTPDSVATPISEIVCHQYPSLDPAPPGAYVLWANPWPDFTFVDGDTIQSGGHSIGIGQEDGGPVVADSVRFSVNDTVKLGTPSGGTFHVAFYLNSYNWVDIGYEVFGGSNPGTGGLRVFVSDYTSRANTPPDTAALSTPEGFRIQPQPEDTARALIAWNPIPEDELCENATGHPANCPDVYGDEVYYKVTEYQVWPDSLLEPGRMWFDTTTAMASTQRSFPWDYPEPGEILPDSIQFCVRAVAADCPGCIGDGGQVCVDYTNGDGQYCSPVSLIGCSDVLEVQ